MPQAIAENELFCGAASLPGGWAGGADVCEALLMEADPVGDL